MSEWWSYRLSDFLMFSPTIYWRLVERYNREVWPLQVLTVAAGVLLLWCAAMRRPSADKVVAGVLALAWLWIGWAFHWERYATINWAAEYFAIAFALQALLLLGVAMSGTSANPAPPGPRTRGIGLVLAAVGVLVYPLAALVAGRPWSQGEMFGVMPDPTALATLGLMLAAGSPHRGWLLVIPALWTLVGLATWWLLRGAGG